jgi:hypothetical protein
VSFRKQWCLRGHDTFLTGRDSRNSCLACRHERNKARSKGIYPKRYCVRGHDISIMGRYASGECKRCAGRPRDYIELLVTQEMLPIAPLRRAMDQAGVSVNSTGESLSRQMSRYQRRGEIPLLLADELCVKILGVHPYDVWGPEWFRPLSTLSVGALLAARDRVLQNVTEQEVA